MCLSRSDLHQYEGLPFLRVVPTAGGSGTVAVIPDLPLGGPSRGRRRARWTGVGRGTGGQFGVSEVLREGRVDESRRRGTTCEGLDGDGVATHPKEFIHVYL